MRLVCDNAVDIDPRDQTVFCKMKDKVIGTEKCAWCHKRYFAYKDLDIGQAFFDVSSKHYGIKLSPARAYDIDHKRVYGFYGNHANDSDDYRYLLADIEVF